MLDANVLLLSLIVFLPVAGAIVVAFLPKDAVDVIRYFTLAVTFAVLVLACVGFFGFDQTKFSIAADTMQDTFNLPWIPSFNIEYFMGVDGISFPLIMLTAFVSFLAMWASWSITKYIKGYCILFLLLETGMLGVFMALDFFLFYVFWEVMLLPMYFLIGVWGGPRREYAAIKFFLYTLLGSVLMLIAILMLYFNSDLRAVAQVSDFFGDQTAPVKWSDLHVSRTVEEKLFGQVEIGRRTVSKPESNSKEILLDSRIRLRQNPATAKDSLILRIKAAQEGSEATTVTYSEANREVTVLLHDKHNTAEEVAAALNADQQIRSLLYAFTPGVEGNGTVELNDGVTIGAPSASPVHSFNVLALAAMGQHTSNVNAKDVGPDGKKIEPTFSRTLQIWAFWLLFIGFAIKVPSVPLHTWLPDAHVEAPTPISMILAGVLLKMGGYGIIRFCYPICPFGGYGWWGGIVCAIGVVSMVYGGFAAMAQKDFKRLVAYSSVSHMGYVVLGLGVWSAVKSLGYNPDYWNMGVKGAMFQMIAHGISSAGMFFMVGVVYDRVHHRNLNEFGGLFGKMPIYTALSIGIFFAGLGLPGLCGFWGEAWVVLSVWSYSFWAAIIAASVVIITAGYILWAIQRVYLGSEYKGPHEEALTEINPREAIIAGVLFVFAIIFGVFPYQSALQFMDKTINRQTDGLADWTRRVANPYDEEVAAKRKLEKDKREAADKIGEAAAPAGDKLLLGARGEN